MKRNLTISIVAAVALFTSMTPSTGAVAVGVALHDHIRFQNTYEGGVAVLGSRYAFVGTSTRNIVHVVSVPGIRVAANWHLSGLGNGLTYGMERMALSPDNRWLYVMNGTRTDVVGIDVTGKAALRDISLYPQHNGIPTAFVVNSNGARLYVEGGRGSDILQHSHGFLSGTWRRRRTARSTP